MISLTSKACLVAYLTNFCCLLLTADTLTFDKNSELTGTIQSIDSMHNKGVISLAHNSTSQPIRIKSKHINQILFSSSKTSQQPHKQTVYLHSGETLPCNLLALDDTTISIGTNYAGVIEIARKNVAHINFAAQSSTLIYQGPNSSQEWPHINDWVYESGHLISKSKSKAYQEFALPECFTAAFHLRWDEDPKFKFYFCTDSAEVMKKTNRYMLFFNSSGIEIKRVTPTRYSTITQISRRPESFQNNSVHMELKVDRKRGQITVLLDKEEVGTFQDNSKDIPMYNGFIFESTPRPNGSLTISDITISPWNGVTALNKEQQKAHHQQDSFYDTQGQFFSGKALSLERDESDDLLLNFRSPHASKTMQVSLSKITNLYFSGIKNSSKVNNKPSIHIELSSSGELYAQDVSLLNNTLTVNHITLGELVLQKSSVTSMRQKTRPNKNPTKK